MASPRTLPGFRPTDGSIGARYVPSGPHDATQEHWMQASRHLNMDLLKEHKKEQLREAGEGGLDGPECLTRTGLWVCGRAKAIARPHTHNPYGGYRGRQGVVRLLTPTTFCTT